MLKSFAVSVGVFLSGLFGTPLAQPAAHIPTNPIAANVVVQEAPDTAHPTVPAATPPASLPTTIINQPVVQRTVQTVAGPMIGYVTESELSRRLAALSDTFARTVLGTTYPAPSTSYSSGGVWNSIALMGRVENLSGTKLSDITVDGVSGLTASSIPDLSGSYLSIASTSAARSTLGLSYATSDDISKQTHIAAWGDSLTSGTAGTVPYTTVLSQLSGYAMYNGGVGGETSTQITNRMLAATDKYSWPTIIWAGRNDGCSATTVKSNIASMVSALASVGNTNYLILGVLNGLTEGAGSGAYTCITELNSDLATIYGLQYIDIRAHLVSLYDPNQAQDVADYANDIPPTSLHFTGDSLHLNSLGYQAVAQKIYESFSVLQPADSSVVLTPSNVMNLLASPPTIGSTTPGTAYFSRMAIGTTTNHVGRLTLDAQGGANAAAITFSGLQLTTNTLLDVRGGSNNFGWKLRSSGGSQDIYSVSDNYLSNVLQLNTGSSTFSSYFNTSGLNRVFGFGTTTATHATAGRVAISGLNTNTASGPLLNFVDLGTSMQILGVRTAASNSGWTITATGGANEFFNVAGPNTTTPSFQIYSHTGSFNSYWNPQNASSKFGFGTTSPLSKVTIAGNASIGSNSNVAAPTNGLLVEGSVGIGTTTPWRKLSITGTVGFDGLTGSTGAGSLCLDSNMQVVYNSGSDACLSSTRATKHDIQNLNLNALTLVKSLQPVSFVYNNDASSTVRYGFIAEDTAAVDTHLTTYDASGNISGIDDRSIIAIVVDAIRHFADAFTTKELTFTRASGDELTVKKLCVEDVCVTRDQFLRMVEQGRQAPAQSSPTPSEPGEPQVDEAPLSSSGETEPTDEASDAETVLEVSDAPSIVPTDTPEEISADEPAAPAETDSSPPLVPTDMPEEIPAAEPTETPTVE